MKKKITFIIVILIVVICLIIFSNAKNKNITKREDTSKEQLTQTTSSNAYVDMATHLSEVSNSTSGLGSIEYDIKLTMGSNNVSTTYTYVEIPNELLKLYSKMTFTLTSKGTGNWYIRPYLNSVKGDTILSTSNAKGDIYEYDISTITDTDVLQLCMAIGAGSGNTIVHVKYE